MSILPKVIYRFNVIPIKLPIALFTELGKKFQKFMWYHKRPRIAKVVLRGKKTSRTHNFPGLQTILQHYSNQDSMVMVHKQICRLWNRIENPEINPET